MDTNDTPTPLPGATHDVYEVTLRVSLPRAPHPCGSTPNPPHRWNWQAIVDERYADLPDHLHPRVELACTALAEV